MRVFYLYDGILPSSSVRGKHAYSVSSNLAIAGAEVCLLLMAGSYQNEELFQHHYGKRCALKFPSLQIWPLFSFFSFFKRIGINVTWPFLFLAHSMIESASPEYLICSKISATKSLLRSKVDGVRYIQEVFELPYYPLSQQTKNLPYRIKEKILETRAVLNDIDLVIVPTQEMLNALRNPPYFVRRPEIKILSLASSEHRLPPKRENLSSTIELFYLGELHPDNGLEDLCEALTTTENIHLHIITQDLKRLETCRTELEAIVGSTHITFHSYPDVETLRKLLYKADAFVAPFRAIPDFLHRAHPSICDYMMWCRPIVAPNIPVVRNLLPKGVWQGFLYEIENINSLQAKLHKLRDTTYRFMISENLYEIPVDAFSHIHRAQILKRLLKTCR